MSVEAAEADLIKAKKEWIGDKKHHDGAFTKVWVGGCRPGQSLEGFGFADCMPGLSEPTCFVAPEAKKYLDACKKAGDNSLRTRGQVCYVYLQWKQTKEGETRSIFELATEPKGKKQKVNPKAEPQGEGKKQELFVNPKSEKQ